MKEYIYRYISLATFINMVQTQALNFVLPTTWEDVKENSYLTSWIEAQDKDIRRLYIEILANKTFAQSWTSLEESDAMWRIYSYDNQSLRIRISQDSVALLGGVYFEPVVYCDEYIEYNNTRFTKSEIFLKLIAQKRTAFSHEHEIRLIYVDVPETNKLKEGLESMFVASNILNGAATNTEIEDYSNLIEKLNYLNIHHAKTNHLVSFSHLSDFISGVMVNPFAPSWYVNTVKRYCELNKIPFEGKSKLYEGENDE